MRKSSYRVPMAPLAAGMVAAVALVALSGPALAQPKGDVMIALPTLRQQFDPTEIRGAVDQGTYEMLQDGLINLGPDGKFPALAESWTISKDGKQIDFKLRRNAKFHNGDPLSAEDVKFTYERVLSTETGHAYRQGFVDSIERIEVVAPDHVRFILKAPWPAFFTSIRLGLQAILPKAYYERVGPKGYQEKPIGTGPFKLADLKAGEWTRFEANTDYWGGAPKVKSVTFRLVQEPFTRYAMLERGEADIILGLTGPLLERIRANPNVRILLTKYSGTNVLHFDRKSFPESADRRVRLAIAHGIKVDEIAQSILPGICEPASSVFTPATFGYLDGLPRIPYDLAKAKQLLQEAGIKPGHKVTFNLHTQSFAALPNAPQVLEAIAGNLEALGFAVERQPTDSGAWLQMMRGGRHPMIYYGPSSSPDDGGETINAYYVSWSGWTNGNIKVPEYDEVYKQQLAAFNPEERIKILQRFAKLESERLESPPLLWCHTPFALSKRVKTFRPAVSSAYHMYLRDMELAN